MLPTLRIPIPFGQAKVYNVHVVLSFAYSNQEIVWFDVSMKEQSRVDVLYALNHLISQHQHRLERKFSLAVIEQIFETRPQQVHDHD